MRNFRCGLAVVLAAGLLSACTVTTKDGYEHETKFGQYVRTLPQGYGNTHPVVLKPPSMTQPMPVYRDDRALAMAPTVPEPMPRYAGPTFAPNPDLQPEPPAPELGTVYAAPMPAPLTMTTTTTTVSPVPSSYASPVIPAAPMAPVMTQQTIQLTPPPAPTVTREVDYGDSITIYPVDSSDAAMPYIPPAPHSTAPVALRRTTSKTVTTTTTPSGYNQ